MTLPGRRRGPTWRSTVAAEEYRSESTCTKATGSGWDSRKPGRVSSNRPTTSSAPSTSGGASTAKWPFGKPSRQSSGSPWKESKPKTFFPSRPAVMTRSVPPEWTPNSRAMPSCPAASERAYSSVATGSVKDGMSAMPARTILAVARSEAASSRPRWRCACSSAPSGGDQEVDRVLDAALERGAPLAQDDAPVAHLLQRAHVVGRR